MSRPSPSPPRVAVVTSRLDVGGAERHLARVLPELKRRGLDIVLYAMERGGPLEDALLAQGLRIAGAPRHRFLHWPRATLALARWLMRERPAVVHFFLPRPYVFGSLAAELAGHRRRLMSRRSLTDYQAQYPLLGFAERLLHRRTAGLLANSAAVLAQLKAEVDDPRKLAVIHNGVELPPPRDAAARQIERRALGLDDSALTIAVVANLIAYKGHRDLLQALASIKDDLPQPWALLAIGRDDGIGAALRQAAADLAIAANVHWLGERAAVEPLLGASDLFVLPSHQEGFSNALLEAMAAGLPVIATRVGGNVDAVVENVTGLLVPPRAPPALAEAIGRLARDPALRGKLGAAARLRVARYFSLQACVARYETLYRAMSAAAPAPVSEILPLPSTAT